MDLAKYDTRLEDLNTLDSFGMKSVASPVYQSPTNRPTSYCQSRDVSRTPLTQPHHEQVPSSASVVEFLDNSLADFSPYPQFNQLQVQGTLLTSAPQQQPQTQSQEQYRQQQMQQQQQQHRQFQRQQQQQPLYSHQQQPLYSHQHPQQSQQPQLQFPLHSAVHNSPASLTGNSWQHPHSPPMTAQMQRRTSFQTQNMAMTRQMPSSPQYTDQCVMINNTQSMLRQRNMYNASYPMTTATVAAGVSNGVVNHGDRTPYHHVSAPVPHDSDVQYHQSFNSLSGYGQHSITNMMAQLQTQSPHPLPQTLQPLSGNKKRKGADWDDYPLDSSLKKKTRAKKKRTKRPPEPVDPSAPPKPKRKTGLNKPLILSDALSLFVGGDKELSRPEIVKILWKYIKDNDLQDPADRRFILCDEKLKTLFDQDRVNSFGMNRDLSAHLTKKTDDPAADDPLSNELSQKTQSSETHPSSTPTTFSLALSSSADLTTSPTALDTDVMPTESTHIAATTPTSVLSSEECSLSNEIILPSVAPAAAT